MSESKPKSVWVIEQQETSEGWHFAMACATAKEARQERDIFVANAEQMQFRIVRYDRCTARKRQ